MRTELLADSRIKEVLFWAGDEAIVSLDGKKSDFNLNFYADCKKLVVDTCIEGRYPEHDNEILLTNVIMKKIDAKMGDTVTVSCKNTKKSFVIVGKGQRISNMGLCGTVCLNAVYRFSPDYKVTDLYIYLKEGNTAKDMLKVINHKYKDETCIQSCNFDETYDSILRSFTVSLSTLSVVFVILTILIIILIIFLVFKMKLAKERRYVGVYKALGYTTIQIIWQNVMSFAPVLCAGGVIGIVFGKLFVNKAFVILLSVCGIQNASLIVAPALMGSILGGVVVMAFLVSIICSLGVRKIEPYKMITE